MSPMKSSSGLDENIAGMLCYLFTFVGGIIFLAVEKRSRFVLFHALQSVTVFGLIMVGHVLSAFLPLFGPLVASLLSLLGVIVWLLTVIASLQENGSSCLGSGTLPRSSCGICSHFKLRPNQKHRNSRLIRKPVFRCFHCVYYVNQPQKPDLTSFIF